MLVSVLALLSVFGMGLTSKPALSIHFLIQSTGRSTRLHRNARQSSNVKISLKRQKQHTSNNVFRVPKTSPCTVRRVSVWGKEQGKRED